MIDVFVFLWPKYETLVGKRASCSLAAPYAPYGLMSAQLVRNTVASDKMFLFLAGVLGYF